ncbi:MAG: 16S rRNA (cytidine(1402)-2'-O)-methyltransferase [Thermodesulfobacteriota bacterium]|nr:16S rRNA (cytidine(1402)-2'-O)-methyltransferase [Thermodesulfobacteriota bacterium]
MKNHIYPEERGKLYIVATPIGNLEDITYRAVRILKEVNIVASEDTRHSKILFNHYNVNTPLVSYYEYNKYKRTPQLIENLLKGKDLALVSDAGTPGISDPGYFLIKVALEHNIPIIPIPGTSSLIAALSVSGLPTDRFIFEGFLPRKKIKRRTYLEKLKNEKGTFLFFESPYRILRTLNEILNLWGDRDAVLAREITKIYEEFIREKISKIIQKLESRKIRGEITLLVAGKKTE